MRVETTPAPVAGPNATPVEEPPTFTPTKTAAASPTRRRTDGDMGVGRGSTYECDRDRPAR
ncbi:MAG: hypothetical protein ABEJ42_01260 [Halobacteriaceae archaeon]